jgi:cytochrome P450
MTVSVAQYTVSTSEQYFTNACQYHPERWEKTSEDMKHNPRAYNPFVMNGYRGCLGRTLAYAEMRLILAKLVMSYKWTDRSGSWDWRDQKAFLMWQKNPVIVDLKIRGS